MTNYIKSEGYIFANLCDNVAQALYAAMIQKGWSERTAQERAHRGDRTLQDITKTLAELGAHMEVTVRFISRRLVGRRSPYVVRCIS